MAGQFRFMLPRPPADKYAMRRSAFALMLVVPLAGCEMLGIPDPAKEAAAKEAEGKAVGSACRHALRAIEDCYTLNPKAQKAAVFQGWREMDEYMRENKLEGVAPSVPRPDAKKKRGDEEEEAPAKPAKPASR
jgi:hypothetical protein